MNSLHLSQAIASELLTQDCGPGRAVMFSYRSPQKETDNEDSLLVWSDGGRAAFAVADGVGGSRSGAIASRLAIRCLEEALAGDDELPLRTRVIDAFEHANRAVLETGLGGPPPRWPSPPSKTAAHGPTT